MLIRQAAEAFLLETFERQLSEGRLGGFIDVDAALRKLPKGVNSQDIITWLEERGRIYIWPSEDDEISHLGSIQMSDDGRIQAEALMRRARSRVEREAHLHSKLVRWAHEQAPPGGRAKLQLFAAHPYWWFCGTEVSWDEVFAALAYLEERGLLNVSRSPAGAEVWPTALGIDFAHSNIPLRNFMDRHQPSAANVYIRSTVVQGDAPGSNLATGDNSSQTVNQGAEPDALAALIVQLRNLGPALELSQEDAQDFEEGIYDLEREGRDPERAPRIWRSLRRILTPAATSAAVAGAEAGVTEVLHAGAAIFG
ncbi:hypothetical protein [Streptomyces sp. NPDC056045]|uniref:hypothetical protein n=1 Tax=Streptomyces sp. NPDC056045 TaxID=3345691 RepID=UPI0035D63766